MPADSSNYVTDLIKPHLEKLQEFTEQSIALLSQGDFDQATQLLSERHSYLTSHITTELVSDLKEQDKMWLETQLNQILAQDLQQGKKVAEMMSVINDKLGKMHKTKKNINSYLDVRNI